DQVGQLDRLFDGLHPEIFLLRRGPRLAALVQADHAVGAAVLEVEGVGMALAAVADHRDPLTGERRHVRVVVVIDLRHYRYVLVVRLLRRGFRPMTWSASTGTSTTIDCPVCS